MKKTVNGEQRRDALLAHLRTQTGPVTGSTLAKLVDVSRQVIVQDLSLLKAQGLPIVATSRGYVFGEQDAVTTHERKIVCRHTLEEMETEMNALVDEGVTIRDVIVEHPVYGYITGQIMVKSRRDVRVFLERLRHENAEPLSRLTDGTHIHTIEADSEEALQSAITRLKELGILVSEMDAPL